MAKTADSQSKGAASDKGNSIPTWSQEANADIESAAKEEVLNYEGANFKKLSPRAAIIAVTLLLAFLATLYLLFSRH